MLAWMVTFVSDEQIVARWRKSKGRVPEHTQRVDRAFLAGEPVAFIGPLKDLSDPDGFRRNVRQGVVSAMIVADTYFVVYQPDPELIRENFQLTE